MKVDAEELVELKYHGSMKLRSAVDRAMLLAPEERRTATIVRQSEPSVLDFRIIRHLSNLFRALAAAEAAKSAAENPARTIDVEVPFVIRLRHLIGANLGHP